MNLKALVDKVEPELVNDTTGEPKDLIPGTEYVLPLDLGRFAIAQKHYENHGFTPIAVPWVVSAAAYKTTLPPTAPPWKVGNGYLVASAEQSFVQLLLDGKSLGRKQAFTPCFRHEEHDSTHLPYFLKLELIDTDNVTHLGLMDMVQTALGFFEQYLPVDLELSGPSLDIISTASGLELGSYGLRVLHHEGKTYQWVYGTGTAEPRLAQALSH